MQRAPSPTGTLRVLVNRILVERLRFLSDAYGPADLDYYLDEFTFRFNRRRSQSRGKLFYRLAQQALAVGPFPYDQIVHLTAGKAKPKPQSVGVT
jgi:hypothetical protein